jgi:DNA-damage-inducible protein J
LVARRSINCFSIKDSVTKFQAVVSDKQSRQLALALLATETHGLCPVAELQCSPEVAAMTESAVVRARIDERTKKEATAALKKIGLTVSDAFRLLLVRVAAEKALPFEPLNPNAETVAAMKAARRGDLIKVGKPNRLIRSLNAGD